MRKSTKVRIALILAIMLFFSFALIINASDILDSDINNKLLLGSSNQEILDTNLGFSDEEILDSSLGFSDGQSVPLGFSTRAGLRTIGSIGDLIVGNGLQNNIVVIPESNPTNYVLFSSVPDALLYLYNQNDNANYVLYVGGARTIPAGNSSDTLVASPTAATINFRTLEGRINELTIVTSPTDPINTGANQAPDSTTITFAGGIYLGTPTRFRNTTIAFSTTSAAKIFGNGKGLILDRGFYYTSTYNISYVGGAENRDITSNPNYPTLEINSTNRTAGMEIVGGSLSGNIDGNITLVINNTMVNTTSGIYGGNKTSGTINGDVSVTINGTGNGFTITNYAGGGGGSSYTLPNGTPPVKVNGNVTTTITNMGAQISNYYGGPIYGEVTGTVTNNISFSQKAIFASAGIEKFFGGSIVSTIGTPGSTGNAIVNNLDFRNFGNSRTVEYVGANSQYARIYGNINTVLWAGQAGEGGRITDYAGIAGYQAHLSHTNVRPTVSTIKASTPEQIRNQFLANTNYMVYGDTYTEIKSGNFSDNNNKGAGWAGYIKGNVTTVLGTEGLVYGGSNKSISTAESPLIDDRGYLTGDDFTGGGGLPGDYGRIFIEGNTLLDQRNTLFRWTYGAGYSGYTWGNTTNILSGGVVDTLEGAGYWDIAIWGKSTAIINGGQVDWFFSGAGWEGILLFGDVEAIANDGTINAHIGGAYGTDEVFGNSKVTIRGGDLSGQPRYGGTKKMGAGSSNNGAIYGNAEFNIDLRGATRFVKPPDRTYLSGGRPYGAASAIVLGTNANNTITLNVYTDPGSDLLNNVIIYGDGGLSGTNTKSGHLTINIDAPDSIIGEFYSTEYSTVSSSVLQMDVVYNIYNVKEIGTLSGTDKAGDITNTIAANSALVNRYIKMNFIGAAGGSIETTSVGNGGIINFTHMLVDNYDILVTNGSIKNGKNATTANRATYYLFGEIKLQNNSAFGISGGTGYIAGGKLIVLDDSKLASPGGAGKFNISDIDIAAGAVIQWTNKGGTAEAGTGTWFGASPKTYKVFTFSPTSQISKALGITPLNMLGRNSDGSGYYIGDNDVKSSTTLGYGIAIAGARIDFEVESGLGAISHNVNAFVGTPTAGQLPITALSSVARNTGVQSGWLITTDVNAPALTFTPDTASHSWFAGGSIKPSIAPAIILNHALTEAPYTHSIAPTDSYVVKGKFTNTPELTAKNAVIRESDAVEITAASEVDVIMQVSGRPQLSSDIDATKLSQISALLAASETYRVHDITYTVDNGTVQETKAVKLYVVPDTAVIDPTRSYVLWSQDANMTVAEAQAITNRTMLDTNYTKAYAIEIMTAALAVPDINATAVTDINSVTAPSVVTVTYTYKDLTTNSVINIDASAPELLSVPDLIFGQYTNRGIPDTITLAQNATISVKDERPAGATFTLSVRAYDLEEQNSGGTITLPANRLVYISAGTKYPLNVSRTIFSGASIAGTPVQNINWDAGTNNNTVVFETSGTDTIGDYEGVVVWTIGFTP